MALIALGVTGGIGAYKAVEVARLLQKQGHDVVAIMTRSARRFVGPVTFEAITRRRVITDQWTPGTNADIEHISIASDIALLLVAPATANIIGKFAHGIADDFLSSLFLATDGAGAARAGDEHEHAGAPGSASRTSRRCSRAACDSSSPAKAIWRAAGLARGGSRSRPTSRRPRSWCWHATKRCQGGASLVTAGPTYEDLDPVRFVGNRSSGRMGYAIAAELAARGAEVVLVTGPTSLSLPAVASVVRTRTAEQMHRAVIDALPGRDALVMAAAVANYSAADRRRRRRLRTMTVR